MNGFLSKERRSKSFGFSHFSLKLRVFNAFDFVSARVREAKLNCFGILFVVTDAIVLVRFPCCCGATSPTSQNLVKTNG